MIVRPVAARDRAEWQTLWQGYNAFYGRIGATALAPEIVELAWQRLLDPAEPAIGLVAEADRLLGLAHLIPHRNMIQIADTCYLQDLYVSPAARGTGCGRKLIEAVYAAADANGTPTVYWTTEHHNATGRQLYDRIGTLTDFIKYQRPAA